MSYQNILFSIEQGVATLILNRPEKLNSFTRAMHLEVRDALARVERDALDGVAHDARVRVLLISGAGRGFCAGQDLAERTVEPGAPEVDLGASVEQFYMPLVLALRALPLPVVCAVNGVAAGAGANLALACDIVLAAHSATFIEAFCRLGLIPDTGGTWHLPRLVGRARSLGMALLGEKIDALTAEKWGLIWKCLPDEVLMGEARELAAHLAQGPTRGFASTKRAFEASYGNSLEQQLMLEASMMRELGRSHDFREGVAAFMEKRTPRFTGE